MATSTFSGSSNIVKTSHSLSNIPFIDNRMRQPKSTFYQKGPYYHGVALWNELDLEVQLLKTEDELNGPVNKLYPVNY